MIAAEQQSAQQSGLTGPTTSEATNLTAAQIDAGLFNTDGYALANGQFTYSIPTASSSWPGYAAGSEPFTSYAALTATQGAQFGAAIALWDSYIAPNFAQVSDANGGGFIRVAFTAESDADSYAYAYQGSGVGQQGPKTGDIWINDTGLTPSTVDFSAGTYGFEALLHEIGHTLGLKHSFEAPMIPSSYDSRRYTVMSYTDPTDNVQVAFRSTAGGGISSYKGYVNPQTPMVLDIQAVQDLYGADQSTNAGDTVYRLSDNDYTNVHTLYDASGNDTIDLSGLSRGSLLDLTPGGYSSIDRWSVADQKTYWIGQFGSFYATFIGNQFDGASYTGHDNLGLSFSTTIENAIGSSHDDTIIASDLGSHINGAGGNDLLIGGVGAVLTGGSGQDVFQNAFSNETVTDMAVGEYFLAAEGGGGYYNIEPYDYTSSTLTLNYNRPGSVHVTINPSSYFGEIDDSYGRYIVRLYAHDAAHADFGENLQSDILFRGGDGVTTLGQVTGYDYPHGVISVDRLTTIDGASPSWSIQGSLDYDNDHLADLLWHNATTGQIAIWDNLSRSPTSNGALFNESAYVSAPVALSWHVAGVADVNDDGRDDILWRNDDGSVTSWLSTGTGFDINTAIAGVATSWHIQGAADVDGDGRADLVWRNADGSLTTWKATATGFSTATPVVHVDTSWHVDAVADVTGDGYADLLWRNDNGAISVWSGTGNGFIQNSYYHAPIGNDWHIAGTGDYTGDGKSDILWHNDDGTISIWVSTSAGTTANFDEGSYTNGSVAHDQTIIATHYDII